MSMTGNPRGSSYVDFIFCSLYPRLGQVSPCQHHCWINNASDLHMANNRLLLVSSRESEAKGKENGICPSKETQKTTNAPFICACFVRFTRMFT